MAPERMGAGSWPSTEELDEVKRTVAEMSGRDVKDVKVVVSPYRICPLGAHIDHQDGTVLAMTIDKGILLGFVPSEDGQVFLRSRQFHPEVKFRVDEEQKKSVKTYSSHNASKDLHWDSYVKGALYALKKSGKQPNVGITGFLCGSDGLDSSGLSSSAAVGIAYLLALESVNDITVSPIENIELDRLIENEYLDLKNGVMDQSAILLSKYGFLTRMDCKTKEHNLIYPEKLDIKELKILLAFSGLKESLTTTGYNLRVGECQKAAQVLLSDLGDEKPDPRLRDVDDNLYESRKEILDPELRKRADHYFSETKRVTKGQEAWASGDLKEFGKLISASGLSSIENYECGCEPMKKLYEILVRAPGVYGARFSGAGFRGCCLAFVESDKADEAASHVRLAYREAVPEYACKLGEANAVVICRPGDCARIL